MRVKMYNVFIIITRGMAKKINETILLRRARVRKCTEN